MAVDGTRVVADLKELRRRTATELGSQRLAWTHHDRARPALGREPCDPPPCLVTSVQEPIVKPMRAMGAHERMRWRVYERK